MNSATNFKIVAWSGDGKITVPVEGPLTPDRIVTDELDIVLDEAQDRRDKIYNGL